MNVTVNNNDALAQNLREALASMNASRAGASVTVPNNADDGRVLQGPALTIGETRESIREVGHLGNTATVISMEDSTYQALKTIVDNLAPSEELEEEEKLRRQEELEELKRKLQDEEIDFKQALAIVMNIVADAKDKALLERNIAQEAMPLA